MNTAYRACWTCKGTFGKTWSLKPQVVYWIHTTVFRPILTYGSMVWLPTLKYKVSRTELRRLQRLTCLATKGAMRMAPNSCSLCTNGTPSSPHTTEVEAQARIYILLCHQQWKPKSINVSH